MSIERDHGSFPGSCGILLGVGLGGFLDGILFHQLLQWHHMATSAGFPADNLDDLELNTFLDGLFHVGMFAFVVLGITMLWWRAQGARHRWPVSLLLGTVLMGFGIFNLVEGTLFHGVLGLHHVNETVPQDQWVYWDIGFLAWGAVMLVGGWALFRSGQPQFPGEAA